MLYSVPTKTADTVSVLQQAPGTIITRAPDEVQWACGGTELPRAFPMKTRAAASRATSEACVSGGVRDPTAPRLTARPPRPPRAARRQLTAAPALTLARPPPPRSRPRSATPPATPARTPHARPRRDGRRRSPAVTFTNFGR
ncbi:unnamed protein product, partial [Brenthis ino]